MAATRAVEALSCQKWGGEAQAFDRPDLNAEQIS